MADVAKSALKHHTDAEQHTLEMITRLKDALLPHAAYQTLGIYSALQEQRAASKGPANAAHLILSGGSLSLFLE